VAAGTRAGLGSSGHGGSRGPDAPAPSAICLLLGSTKPLAPGRLAQPYSSRAEYQQRYAAAVEATIRDGFALPEDRDALSGHAEPGRLPG